MVDQVRTRDQIIAEFPDNLSFEVEPQDARNLTMSSWGWLSVFDPTANNDQVDTAGIGAWFSPGSKWVNTNAFRYWVCLRSTPGAAIWHQCDATWGTVTIVTGVDANGFHWSIATPSTTPALTLSTTVNGIVKGNGTALLTATPGADYWQPGGTPVDIASGGTGATTAPAARTNLGLGTAATHAATDFDAAGAAAAALVSAEAYTDAAIAGTQPLNSTLTALAATAWAANAIPIGTGAGTLSQTSFAANTFPARSSAGNLVAKPISDFGISFVNSADATAALTALGTGTAALANTGTSGHTLPYLDGANSWSAAQTFLNSSGVKILDTGGTHTVGLVIGEALTADRTLTFITNNANRTINVAGDLVTGGAVTFSGAFAVTFTFTAATNITFPTSGTITTTADNAVGTSSTVADGRCRWVKTSWTHTDFNAAATTKTINIYSLAAGGVVHAVKLKHSTTFTGGAIATYQLSVGVSGGSQSLYLANADVKGQAVSTTTYYVTLESGNFGPVQNLDQASATNITATAVTTGANTNAATQGAVDIWLLVSEAT